MGVFEGRLGKVHTVCVEVSMKLVLVALVAARLVAAGDSALNFLPADTKVVIGIRVSAIRESALFKDAGTDAQKMGEDWMKMVAITGFDPIHDIDEVLIFSAADNEKASALIEIGRAHV